MSMFSKSDQIIDKIEGYLEAITIANNWHIDINNVTAYDEAKFNKFETVDLPAVLIMAGEEMEPETNEQYVSELNVVLKVAFKPDNQNRVVKKYYRKLRLDIITKINDNNRLGLDNFVESALWVGGMDHPVLWKSDIYIFALSMTVRYWFNKSTP